MVDFSALRRNMLESQIKTNRVTSERVHEALFAVPREIFVPAGKESLAYVDEDLAIAPGRYLIEPRVFARMLQDVAIAPGEKVLVVGAGMGYSAAVIAHLGASVVALESDFALKVEAEKRLAGVDAVTVICGVFKTGHAAGAPYDVILIDAAVSEIPKAILAQLADGGRLVGVVRKGPVGTAVLYGRRGSTFGHRDLFDAAPPLLPGFEPKPAFVF